MELFDTHAHLDDEVFDDVRDEIVGRASTAGVTGIICVGVDATASEKCQVIANRYRTVFAAVGIQPNHCHEAGSGDWERILRLVNAPRVVALGETGLDRHWKDCPFPVQQDFFDRHLRLSQTADLPFIVHMRECDEDVLQMLREARRRGPLCGVMHSFTGSAETARECLELGLWISFAGMVTYKKSDELRAVARTVPANRMVVETDSPYLSPHPHRSQRPNEPSLIVHTARVLADLQQVTLEDFASTTVRNSRELFNRIAG